MYSAAEGRQIRQFVHAPAIALRLVKSFSNSTSRPGSGSHGARLVRIARGLRFERAPAILVSKRSEETLKQAILHAAITSREGSRRKVTEVWNGRWLEANENGEVQAIA